jgi:MFS family permease
MLSHREFRRLWTATTIDAFGSWLLVMAVPLHVYESTGSVASTGLTLAVEAAPVLLVGLWAGALVDRWPRGRVLVLGNVAAAAGVALLPFSVYGGLLVENIAICFVQPALAAALPAIVGTGPELAAANAWTSASNSVLRMLGPLTGTFLVARGDFRVVVVVDLASYLVAAALLTRVRVGIASSSGLRACPGLPGGAQAGSAGGAKAPSAGAPRRSPGSARTGPAARLVIAGVLAELRAGLGQVARTRMLSGLVATTWVFWAANAALTILLIPLAGADVGRLIAGLGLGYLLGSAVGKTMIIRFATRTVLTVCYLAVGGCFVVAFAVPALPVIALAGAPGAVIALAVRHRVQVSTPDFLLGRVFAVFLASDASAGVIGALVAPLLGPVTLSAVVLAVAVLALVLLPGGGSVATRQVRDP